MINLLSETLKSLSMTELNFVSDHLRYFTFMISPIVCFVSIIFFKIDLEHTFIVKSFTKIDLQHTTFIAKSFFKIDLSRTQIHCKKFTDVQKVKAMRGQLSQVFTR